MTPVWVNRRALLYLHQESLAQFGGASGIRDEGLLDSAMSRPENKFRYEPDTTIHRLAAAYCFGLAKNHPFLDGNKRAGWTAVIVFLGVNGWRLTADPIEAELMVVALVESTVDEDEFGRWLAEFSQRL